MYTPSIEEQNIRANLSIPVDASVPAMALSSSSCWGRNCAKVLSNGCVRVAKTSTVIALGILATPLIIIGATLATLFLLGGGCVIGVKKFNAKFWPKIHDAARLAKELEEKAKFLAMKDVFTGPTFETAFNKLNGENNPEVKLLQSFVDFFAEVEKAEAEKKKIPISECNQQFLMLLREALKSPYYKQHLQSTPIPLAIKVLQKCSLQIFIGVRAMDYYKDLGKTIYEAVPKKGLQQKHSDAATTPNQELVSILDKSISTVGSCMYTDRGLFGKIGYAMTHPNQATASLASAGGWKRKIAHFLKDDGGIYDSHAIIANNPSLQGTTIWKGLRKDNEEVHVDNVFCGSPTIGDFEIYPELLCVLDTIAANNKLPPKKRNQKIPSRLIYTNFQNLGSHEGEGIRSVTLMKLAEDYPGAFVGITLPKDSAFYKGEGNAWKKEADINGWTELGSIEDFGNKMLQHMLDDSHRSLANRLHGQDNEGQGFYFPPKSTLKGENIHTIEWGNILPTITIKATELFQAKENGLKKKNKKGELRKDEKRELRMAYQEFVYSMIQDYFETEVAKTSETSRLITITACKEHADRAAMESLKKLFLRWVKQDFNDVSKEDTFALMCSGMHARALMTRDRQVIPERTLALLAFMKYVTPEEYLNQFFSLYSTKPEATFTPALS